ncbi:unnamed protein product [Lactuca virosa]|uniref:Uncharacterized protein n=1 Tax=Lactuca virosa TaxID=75947 RepID=A0AAU9LW83_9ASTR|nr:unnamed protein product [Lactuca virosa]
MRRSLKINGLSRGEVSWNLDTLGDFEHLCFRAEEHLPNTDLRELFSIRKQGFDVSLTQQQLHEEHDCEHKMDASVKDHTAFFESLGIAGLSNHSLLFSKTAPVPVVQDEELTRIRQSTYVGNSSSYNSREPDMDAGAQFAISPKLKRTEDLTHQHVDAWSKASLIVLQLSLDRE